jgi:hypothetical protein
VKPIYVRAALAALELAAVAEETEEDARNNEGES